MLKTYLFKLHFAGADAAYRPELCTSDVEAMAKAQDHLDAHPSCEAVDVICGDAELFRIARSG